MTEQQQHYYLPSGWCVCGHHRDDGRRDRDQVDPPTVAQIRQILGPTYQPTKDQT